MRKMFNKKAIVAGAVAGVLLITAGTMAYFSDYATAQANGTAGTLSLALASDINLLNEDGNDILNPGDRRDASFAVTNMGNKSIDVRTTVALTALDYKGDAINFTGSATEQSEFDLYLASDVEEKMIDGKFAGYAPKADAQPLELKSIEGNVIKYVLPEYSLDGNKDEYGDEIETIGDAYAAHAHDYNFVLVFKGETGNEWQASTIQMDVIVEAKQHENTQAGWDIVAQETVTQGSLSQSVVKAEDVITDAAGAEINP